MSRNYGEKQTWTRGFKKYKLCMLYKQLKMRLHQPLETQKSRFIAMN